MRFISPVPTALRALFVLSFALGLLLAPPLSAAAGGPTPVGSAPAELAKDKPFKVLGEVRVTAPGQALVRLSVWMFKDDHYIYDERTSVTVEAPEGVTVGPKVGPTPKSKYDPNFDEEKQIYVGTPTFEVPLSFTRTDAFTVKATLKYQGCNPTQCFFPTGETFELTVDPSKVQAALPAAASDSGLAGPAHEPPSAAAPVQAPSAKAAPAVVAPVKAAVAAAPEAEGGLFGVQDVGAAAGRSLWLAFMVAFGAGLLTSLTPCVYPVIPITLRVLGASQAEGRFQAFSLAFVYVLGMALVYTALGVVAAATGGLFGAWLQSPWVIGTLVVIFVAMGFSMLGAFEIAVPSGIASRLQNVQGRGYPGAFLAGTVSGVVVGPCSAPVLLSLLGFIAESGQIALGSALMFTYAMGLGVLFLVLGTFAASMPRSGAWMDTVKGVLALMIFGVAVWYMRLLVPALYSQAVYMAIVGVFVVVSGTFVGAFHPITWEDTWSRKGRKAVGILAVAAGLLLLLDGALMHRGLEGGIASIGMGGASSPAPKAKLNWMSDEQQGLALGKAQARPVVIDFTASWCAVCQELEHEVFSQPGVVGALDDVVLIRVDGSNDEDPNFVALAEKYKVAALPKVVFVNPEGGVLDELSITTLVSPETFLQRVDAARTGRTALR